MNTLFVSSFAKSHSLYFYFLFFALISLLFCTQQGLKSRMSNNTRRFEIIGIKLLNPNNLKDCQVLTRLVSVVVLYYILILLVKFDVVDSLSLEVLKC